MQGLPTAITLSSISFVTTDAAPIITLSPILTPGVITVFPHIHTLFPIFISFPNSRPVILTSASIGWPAVNTDTLGPKMTLFPISTLQTSNIIQS